MSHTVHIIESPSPQDLLDGREERTSIAQVLTQVGIDCRTYLAVNQEMFIKALFSAIIRTPTGRRPIVHLSMHGNREGLAFTSGERLSWAELAPRLEVANQNVKDNALLLCLSTCEGLSALEMAWKDMPPEAVFPFHTIVAPQHTIAWSDALVAFVSFYHLVIKRNVEPVAAAKTMNLAAGLPSEGGKERMFWAMPSEQIRQQRDASRRENEALIAAYKATQEDDEPTK
jgi:hypothetical protein